MKPFSLTPDTEPATLPRTRIRGPWNGRCTVCQQPGLPGQLVSWDPDSGRPSRWRHVSCTDPYAERQR